MNKPVRLAMWSGPRNISTAMMRSFENRPDTEVSDEPLYAHYLKKTKLDHPVWEKVLKAQPQDWNIATRELTGPVPGGKKVWYQKHMTHHYFFQYDDRWLEKLVNCFLIRDPREVIASYLHIFRLESADQIGFPQQAQLFRIITEMQGKEPLVVDARDILKNPEQMLSAICEKTGIPFTEKMLSWPPGARESDGVWGKYWYKNVVKSSEFAPYKKKQNTIPTRYEKILKECLPLYEELYSYRLRVNEK